MRDAKRSVKNLVAGEVSDILDEVKEIRRRHGCRVFHDLGPLWDMFESTPRELEKCADVLEGVQAALEAKKLVVVEDTDNMRLEVSW